MNKIFISVLLMVGSIFINSCTIEYSTNNRKEVDVFVNISGLDVDANSIVGGYLLSQVEENSYQISGFLTENNGQLKIGTIKNLNANGAYYQFSFYEEYEKNGENLKTNYIGTSINQICTTDNLGRKITNKQDVFININCQTPVKIKEISTLVNNQTISFPSGDIYVSKPRLQTNKPELNDTYYINSDSFVYESNNPDIATIDEWGKVKFLRAGKASFTIKPNPKYYLSNSSVTFNIEAKNSNFVVQSLEIGQSSLLPINSRFQIVAPNNKTLIRALVYSTTNPNKKITATLTIKNKDGTSASKNMICPSRISNRKFNLYHYEIEDTCYSILEEGEEILTKLTKDSIVEFNFNFDGNTEKYSLMPKIALPNKLNIKIVKGENSLGKAASVDKEKLKQRIKQVFPFSEVTIEERFGYYRLERKGTDGNALIDALNKLTDLYKSEYTANSKTHYYALIPTNSCLGNVGLGYVGSPIAVGIAEKIQPNYYYSPECGYEAAIKNTMLHELGHNFSLTHAPCNINDGTDLFWSTSKAWEEVEYGALSKSPLFVQTENTLRAPDKNTARTGYEHDLMGYCDGTRLTKHNYKKISAFVNNNNFYYTSARIVEPNILANRTNKTNEQANAKNYLRIIQGEILYDENKILLQPIGVLSNSIKSNLLTNSFDYWVKIKTKSKEMIYPLTIKQLDHSPKMYFEVILPFNESIEKISFLQGNKLIKHEIAARETPAEIVGRNQNSNLSLAKEKLVDLIDNKIIWNANKYSWLTCVLIEKNGTRTLLTHQSTGGIFTLPDKLPEGKLEVVLSDGINNKINIFELKK